MNIGIRKLFVRLIALLITAVAAMIISITVFADETDLCDADTSWQNDYIFSLDEEEQTVYLEKYLGEGGNVIIPSKVTINNIEYPVVIRSHPQDSFFPYNNIDSFSVEEGVALERINFYLNGSQRPRLKSVDFSGIDSSRLNDIHAMFLGCTGLTELNLSELNISNVNSLNEVFEDCTNLRSVDLTGWDSSNVTSIRNMFSGCQNLKNLDMSGLDVSKVVDMSGCFQGCSSLTSIDLNGWNTSSVTNMSSMFEGCNHLPMIDLSSLDTDKVANMAGMFHDCSSLTDLQLSNLDTRKVNNMGFMFAGCSNLGQLDVSSLDTSSCVEMYSMFEGCKSLSNIDISSWNTSSVIEMENLFSGCSGLETINIGEIDTSNVIDMSGLFSRCSSLKTIDLKELNTSSVVNMSNMFLGCSNLTEIDISSFDTSHTTDMDSLFLGCYQLNRINMSGNDLSSLRECPFGIIGFTTTDNIEVFDTPINCMIDIELPYSMFDENGNEYNSFPMNMQKSKHLTRNAHDISIDNGFAKKYDSKAGDWILDNKAKPGDYISINAEYELNGRTFEKWIVEEGNVLLYEETNSITGFKMGNLPVHIRAQYREQDPAVIKSTITISNGSSSHAMAASGEWISISAAVPVNGKIFDKWVVDYGNVSLNNPYDRNTSFVMPDSAVVIRATYKDYEPVQYLHLQWLEEGSKSYWYEYGKRQGMPGDPKNITDIKFGNERGREIYDPASNGWYWLDAIYGGAKAVDKEVWMPYIYQDEANWSEDEITRNAAASGTQAQQVINAIHNHEGKWVRYDMNGKMYKGWYTVTGRDAAIYPDQIGNTYYYDWQTGLMAKGWVSIDGYRYFFDEITGVLQQ